MTDAEFWSHLALGKCLISERVDVTMSFLSKGDIQQSPTIKRKKTPPTLTILYTNLQQPHCDTNSSN